MSIALTQAKPQSQKALKIIKTVFVIMPFERANDRGSSELKSFFVHAIQKPVEAAKLKSRYKVRRSDDSFNINAKIIEDLYRANIVICDLSGPKANPNVMYELGLRLALSDSPVILIREAHTNNETIFDIGGFYIYEYKPTLPDELSTYIINTIKRYESEEEKDRYHNPIMEIIKDEVPLLIRYGRTRASRLIDGVVDNFVTTSVMFSVTLNRYVEKWIAQKKAKGSRPEIRASPHELRDDILNNADFLGNIDWGQMTFSIKSLPTVDNYIANQYLIGLIDSDVEEALSECMREFHALYLATDVIQWRDADVYKIFSFVNEISLLVALLDRILIMLNSTDRDELDRARQEFFEWVKEYRRRGDVEDSDRDKKTQANANSGRPLVTAKKKKREGRPVSRSRSSARHKSQGRN